jgi:hypothetical protein
VLVLTGGRQPAVDKLMVENPRSVILLNVPASARHPAFPWALAQVQAAPEPPEPVLRRRRAPRKPPAGKRGRPAG